MDFNMKFMDIILARFRVLFLGTYRHLCYYESVVSQELLQLLDIAKKNFCTPHWLYELNTSTVKESHSFEKFPVLTANLDIDDKYPSINLGAIRQVHPARNLTVVYRGPLQRVLYLASGINRTEERIDTPRIDVTIVMQMIASYGQNHIMAEQLFATFDQYR